MPVIPLDDKIPAAPAAPAKTPPTREQSAHHGITGAEEAVSIVLFIFAGITALGIAETSYCAVSALLLCIFAMLIRINAHLRHIAHK